MNFPHSILMAGFRRPRRSESPPRNRHGDSHGRDNYARSRDSDGGGYRGGGGGGDRNDGKPLGQVVYIGGGQRYALLLSLLFYLQLCLLRLFFQLSSHLLRLCLSACNRFSDTVGLLWCAARTRTRFRAGFRRGWACCSTCASSRRTASRRLWRRRCGSATATASSLAARTSARTPSI